MGSEITDASDVPVRLDEPAASSLRLGLADWTVDTGSQLVRASAVRALDREPIVPARLGSARLCSARLGPAGCASP